MKILESALISNLARRTRSLVAQPNQALAAILVVAVAARVIMALSTAPILTPDSFNYYFWARSISWHFNFWPVVAYRTPLYPGFLAVFLRYFGESPATGNLVIAAQYLMGVLSTVLVYRLVRKLFSNLSAFLAALLFTSSPLILYSETLVQTESLFIFLFLISISLMVRILERGDLALVAVLGVVCGLLTLTRPVAQLLPAVLLMALVAKRIPFKRFLVTTALLTCAYGGTLYPWMKINYYAFDRWTVAQLSGVNLFHRVFDLDKIEPVEGEEFSDVLAIFQQERGSLAGRDTYFSVLDRLGRKLGSPVAADEKMFAFALASLKREPVTFFVSTLGRYLDLFMNFDRTVQFCDRGTDRFLCSRGTLGRGTVSFPNQGREFGFKLRLLIDIYFTMYDALLRYEFFVFLAFVGAVVAIRRGAPQRGAAAFLLAIVVYFTFVTGTLSDADDRFRLPIDGLVYAFCALGIEALWVNRRRFYHATDIHNPEHLPVPAGSTIVRKLNGDILFWDAVAEQGYGWQRQEVVGGTTHTLFSTQFPAPLDEINEQLLQRRIWEGSLTHTRKDGTRITVKSRWELVAERAGEDPLVIEVNQLPDGCAPVS